MLLTIKRSYSQHSAQATQTIKDFCPVNFFLFLGFARKTNRYFLYCLGKRNSQVKETILNARRKFSTQGKFSTQEKILNLGENCQLKRKFSILHKILSSRKNSQHRRKKITTITNKIIRGFYLFI